MKITVEEREIVNRALKEGKIASYAELDGVEIFRVGTWNGDTYTEKDLNSIVDNFNALRGKQAVPIKLGHSDDQKFLQKDGLPSAGWISSLKRVGDKIVATIKDMPQKIFDLVTEKAYKKVSAEIYPVYKDAEGNKYRNVLRAVALLGSDIPAVEGLSDIQALYSADGQSYKSYVLETVPTKPLDAGKWCVPPEKYSEDFQERFDDLIDEVMSRKNYSREEAIVYVVRKDVI